MNFCIKGSDVTTVSSAPGSIPPPPPPPLPPPEPLEDNTCSELNISCENTFTRNSTLDSRTALMEAIRSGTTLKVYIIKKNRKILNIFYIVRENIYHLFLFNSM